MIAFRRDYIEDGSGIENSKRPKPDINSEPPNRYERLYGNFSEEGRALASLLAKDNFLYEDLVYICYRQIPSREADRMDFLQDFFLHITKNAVSFDETFIGVDNLRDYHHGKNWLIISLRNFVGDYWNRQFRRIRKEPGKPRAKEFNVGHNGNRGYGNNVNGDNSSWLSKISLEIYLKNKGEQFPGIRLLEQEEKEEFEYKRRLVRQTIEDAMERLTKSEREVVRLHYFEGLSLEEIAKRRIQVEFHMKDCYITAGSAKTHLWSARKKLREMLPPEICSTRTWIRSDYRISELAA